MLKLLVEGFILQHHMFFLSSIHEIKENYNNDLSLDMKFSVHSNLFITTSQTHISTYEAETIDQDLIYRFVPDKANFGAFISSVPLNTYSFCTLTSAGTLLYFQHSDGSRIECKKEIGKQKGRFYTCISSYRGFIVAGDSLGSFSLLSVDSDHAITYKVSPFPLKKIEIGKRNALILCADGSVISIRMDAKILSTPGFDINPVIIVEKGITMICCSHVSLFAGLYGPKIGFLVSDFNTTMRKFSLFQSAMCMCFSPDGMSIFIALPKNIAIWSDFLPRVRYFNISNPGNCKSIAISDQSVLASFDNGIVSIPIITHTMRSFPLLFSSNMIYEFRQTEFSIIPMTYQCNEIGSILDCTIDDEKRYMAVCGSRGVAFCSRASAKWFFSLNNDFMIKSVSFMGNVICMLCISHKELSYYLSFCRFSDHNGIHNYKSIPIIGVPHSFCASSKNCVIGVGRKVFLFNEKTSRVFNVSKDFFKCEIDESNSSLIIFTKDYSLIQFDINNVSNEIVLIEGISSFFYDRIMNKLFVYKGFSILLFSNYSNEFKKLLETELLPIGDSQQNNGIILLDPGAVPPFNPVIVQYYNSTHNYKVEFDRISVSDRNINYLVETGVSSIYQGCWESFFTVLYEMHSDFYRVLVSVLRIVGNDIREQIYAKYGKPKEIYQNLLEKPSHDIATASLLLPLLLEEDGPEEAYILATSILMKDADMFTSISRFIDPVFSILSKKKINPESIESKISTKSLEIIRKNLECSIIYFMKTQRYFESLYIVSQISDIKDFLQENSDIDVTLSIESIYNNFQMSHETKIDSIHSLIEDFLDAGWPKMSLSLVISYLREDNIKEMIMNEPRFALHLKDTKWEYFV